MVRAIARLTIAADVFGLQSPNQQHLFRLHAAPPMSRAVEGSLRTEHELMLRQLRKRAAE